MKELMCWIQGINEKVYDDTSLGESNDGKHPPETSTKTIKLCHGISISSIVHYINLATGPIPLRGQICAIFTLVAADMLQQLMLLTARKPQGWVKKLN